VTARALDDGASAPVNQPMDTRHEPRHLCLPLQHLPHAATVEAMRIGHLLARTPEQRAERV
jgi:hypothetical protein